MTDETPEKVEYEIHGFYRTLDLSGPEGLFRIPALSGRQYWDLTGNFIAILGRNGSGKTTILRALSDALFPHLRTSSDVDREGVRTMSASPVWAGGFVVKRVGPPPAESTDRDEQIERLKEHFGDDAWKYATKFADGVPELMSEAYLDGIDWQSYVPIGSTAWKFYNLLWSFSSPYAGSSYSKFHENLSNEFLKSGFVILMPHQFVPRRRGMDEEVHAVGILPVRCTFNNEDSPLVQSHFDALKVVYRNMLNTLAEDTCIPINQLDWRDVAAALKLEKVTCLYQDEALELNVQDSPIFNPWNLSMPFTWMLDEDFESVFTETPNMIFDWPNVYPDDERIDQKPAQFLNAGADPWLFGYKPETFIHGVFAATGFKGQNPWDAIELKDPTKTHSSAVHKHRFEERSRIESHARDLLLSWGILPKWEDPSSDLESPEGFQIKSLSIASDGVDTFGWINDVTTRWVSRALQISILKHRDSTNLPKVLIWDEPELGLHPIAIRKLTDEVIPSLTADGFKIISATHSMAIASKADQIYESSRNQNWDAGLTPVSKFDLEKLEQLGFTSSDELLTRKGFAIVEGKHDYLMIDALFGDKLTDSRIDLLALQGISKAVTLLEAPLLLKLGKPLMVITDGGDRSGIDQKTIQNINENLKTSDPESLERLAEITSKIEAVDEGITIKMLLEKFIEMASREHSAELLRNLSIFMLRKNDILDYLEPRELWPSESGDTDWQNFEKKYREYEKQREKAKSDGSKVSKNKKSKKSFYRSELRLPLDDKVVNQAINKMLDRSVSPDFTALEEQLFGESAFHKHLF